MRRVRQHVNPLKMNLLIPRCGPLELPEGKTVEVELGCGDARFLFARALAHPERWFVGVDIRDKFLDEAREAVERLGLSHCQLLVSNLLVDADRLFRPGSIHRFYINFPDPWFKRRQHNRRWLTAESVEQLAIALEPGGEIFFQSDVWSVALEALALLESSPKLRNRCGDWSFCRPTPFEAQSTREMCCLEEGLPIWRMLFSRGEPSFAPSLELGYYSRP